MCVRQGSYELYSTCDDAVQSAGGCDVDELKDLSISEASKLLYCKAYLYSMEDFSIYHLVVDTLKNEASQ